MRILRSHRCSALLALAFLAACGEATPPPASPAETPAAAPAPEAAAPAAAPADSAAAKDPAAPAKDAAPAAKEPTRAAPTLDGSLLGKPFKAVGACVIGAPKKGFVLVEIYDAKDYDVKTSCGALPPVEGNRKIGVLLPWKAGEKVDLASIKASKDPDGYVMEALAGKKFARKDAGKEWKPQGTIEILRASPTKGDVARIKISTTSGKDKLEGEIDVEVIPDVAGSWGN